MKTLEAWLEYIQSIHPKKMDLTLERVRAVAEKMQLIPVEYFVITVAGTNGKGSTTTLLSQALTNAGYQVGSTLSPHLHRFNERININGQPVSDQDIVKAFAAIEASRSSISLSYFEFAILASLYVFKNQKVQIAILEVGLGGRFDAVNIVDTDIAVITNIALDHMEYLGPDRESIAEAKAGIIRENKPVFFGEEDIPEMITKEVFLKRAQLIQYKKDFFYETSDSQLRIKTQKAQNYLFSKIPLVPINIAMVVSVLDEIHEQFPVNQQTLIKTVESFQLPGRWQIQNDNFVHVYDVCHNPHGIKQFLDFLEKLHCEGKTYAIFSMLNSKQLLPSIEAMRSVIDTWLLAPLSHPSGYQCSELENAMRGCDIDNYQTFTNIAEAYHWAQSNLNKNDRLLVLGSFHTVAEVQQNTSDELFS